MVLHAVMRGIWEVGIVLMLVLGRLASSASASASAGSDPAICGRESLVESVLAFRDNYCLMDGHADSIKFVRVTEVIGCFLER